MLDRELPLLFVLDTSIEGPEVDLAHLCNRVVVRHVRKLKLLVVLACMLAVNVTIAVSLV